MSKTTTNDIRQTVRNLSDALTHAAEQTGSYENSMAWLEAFEAAAIYHCPELQDEFMQVINICSNFLDGYHKVNHEE